MTTAMPDRWRYGNLGGPSPEVEVVRGIYEAFARRDLEAALRLIAEDAELVVPGTAEQLGRTEPYRGHAGVRQYFADAQRVWRELVLHADDIRAAGGGVVVFGHVEGRVGDAPVRRQVVWTWKVREGKAWSVRASDVGQAPAP
jgi:ketosteroid isomerase-like protein